jgi:hypothetical protein
VVQPVVVDKKVTNSNDKKSRIDSKQASAEKQTRITPRL